MDLNVVWRKLASFTGLALVMGLAGVATPQTASAQSWHWEQVQYRAYLVEDRSEDLYEQILQEAGRHYADEEYALQLSYEMAAQAHRFSYEVDRFAWMSSSYTHAEFQNLYRTYYRLNEALRFNSFSYHVNQLASDLGAAMSYLSAAYRYRYVHDGWYYVTYRDRWWRAGHRHDRDYYWRLRRDRIERRRAHRDHWHREHRRRRPDYRPPAVPDRPRRPITRPDQPRRPDRPITRPDQPRRPDRPVRRPDQPRRPDRPVTRPDRPRRDRPVARPDRPSRGNDRGGRGDRGRGRRPR